MERFMNKGWLSYPVVPLVLMLLSTGCGLYLHNADRQKLAEEAKKEFEDAIADAPQAAQLALYRQYVTARTPVIDHITQSNANIQLAALLGKEWKTLIDEAKALECTDETEDKVKSRQADAEKLAVSLEKLSGVQEQKKKYLEALNAAAEQEAHFIATQKFLQASLSFLVEKRKASVMEQLSESVQTDDASDDGPSLADVRAVLEEEISVTVYKKIKGKLEPKSKLKKISELLGIPPALIPEKEQANNQLIDRDEDEKDKTEKLANLFGQLPHLQHLKDLTPQLNLNHPGIATTLIGLGYDLARAEEKRVATEIAYAQRVLGMHDLLITKQQNRCKEIQNHLDKKKGFSVVRAAATLKKNDDETVRQTLLRLSLEARTAYDESLTAKTSDAPSKASERQSATRERLRFLLITLASYHRVTTHTKSEIDALTNQRSVLRTERALELAAVRLEEREALIRRGLEGIASFYQNGINQEDLANILRIAQAAGLTAVAVQE